MMKNTYITGFMGAGKTAVARRLANVLNRPFVDMDDLIAGEAGMSVESFFRNLGEDRFREAETGLLRRFAKQKGLVIATGGGTPERSVNRELMRKSGSIVYLHAPFADCVSRIEKDTGVSRPLFKSKDTLRELFATRCDAYADHDFQIDTSGKTPAEVTLEVCEKLRPETSMDIFLGQQSHPIYITWRAPQRLSKLVKREKTFVITDRRVASLHGSRFDNALNGCYIMSLHPGERSKSLRSATRVYEAMLSKKMGRDGLVIAIGGGVITDLGAFTASTYKRGVPFVLVSTSLLGCVDAAIGGKAAINLYNIKNPVGCFAVPMAVLLDLIALRTLPRDNIIDGLVEAYKTGLVSKPKLASFVQDNLRDLMRGDLILLQELIRLSVEAKSTIVRQDFKEAGIRKILNFGHTFGHAVESFNAYHVRHGIAVALGMMVAVSMSQKRGLLQRDVAEMIRSTLVEFLPRNACVPAADEAWNIMMNDKKNSDGKITFVLLADYGRPVTTRDVTLQELRETLNELREFI